MVSGALFRARSMIPYIHGICRQWLHVVVEAQERYLLILMASPGKSGVNPNADKEQLQKVVKELVQESLSAEMQRFKEATASKRANPPTTEGEDP